MVTYLIVHEAIPMLRAQVMAQVGCVLEVLLTVGAPTVLIAIMFLVFLVAVEQLYSMYSSIARSAKPKGGKVSRG